MDYFYDNSPSPCMQQAQQAVSPVYKAYCWEFRMFENLTEFEARMADKLCEMESTIRYHDYRTENSQNLLRDLSIATLVLTAVILLSIFVFILYRLFTHYKHKKQQQQLSI